MLVWALTAFLVSFAVVCVVGLFGLGCWLFDKILELLYGGPGD